MKTSFSSPSTAAASTHRAKRLKKHEKFQYDADEVRNGDTSGLNTAWRRPCGAHACLYSSGCCLASG